MTTDNTSMSIETKNTGDAWDELQSALDRLATGVRDPQAARASRDRMNRLREENRKRLGVQNIAVELIRESRNGR
jgi:hypothetical protein